MSNEPGNHHTTRLDRVFFDSHLHLYDLSHAGFLAFLNRFFINQSISLSDIISCRLLKILSCLFPAEKKYFKIIKIIISLLLLSLIYILISLLIYYCPINNCRQIQKLSQDFPPFRGLVAFFPGVIITVILTLLLIKNFSKKYIRRIINLLSITESGVCGMLLNLELDYLYLSLKSISEHKPYLAIKIAAMELAVKAKTNTGILDDLKQAYEEASRGKPHLKERLDELNNSSKKKLLPNDIRVLKEWLITCYLKKGDSYGLKFGDLEFDKIILTPLMMDFQYKGYDGNFKIHYNLPPDKPIVDQTIDMFNGIKQYMKDSQFRIFEIYPFMGINPDIYPDNPAAEFRINPRTLPADIVKVLFKWIPRSVKNKVKKFPGPENNVMKKDRVIVAVEKVTEREGEAWKKAIRKAFMNDIVCRDKIIEWIDKIVKQSRNNSIQRLMYKYFGEYNGNDKNLYDKFRKRYQYYFRDDGYAYNIDKIRSHSIAGIKFYPPLGFNPWPEEEDKQEKIKFIYRFCNERQIPITVHAHMISFDTISKKLKEKYTDPARWINILKDYPQLKLNFAHMGMKTRENYRSLSSWAIIILEYLKFSNHNIYTDFSCLALKDWKHSFYKDLEIIIKKTADNQNILKKCNKKTLKIIAEIRKTLSAKTAGGNDVKGNNNHIMERILFGTDFMLHLFYNDSCFDYLDYFFNRNTSFNDKEKKLFCNINPRRFIFND